MSPGSLLFLKCLWTFEELKPSFSNASFRPSILLCWHFQKGQGSHVLQGNKWQLTTVGARTLTPTQENFIDRCMKHLTQTRRKMKSPLWPPIGCVQYVRAHRPQMKNKTFRSHRVNLLKKYSNNYLVCHCKPNTITLQAKCGPWARVWHQWFRHYHPNRIWEWQNKTANSLALANSCKQIGVLLLLLFSPVEFAVIYL